MKKNALAKAIEWFVAFFEPLPPDVRRKIVYQPKNPPVKEVKMPLVKSAKPTAFKKNIATEVKSGKPVKQAVAIAYSEARAANKSKAKAKK
jgi:hypothetical protein